MGGHGGQVGAEHQDARLAAAGRPAAGDQLAAEVVGQLGVADEAVPAAPPGRTRSLVDRDRAGVDELVGQHARGDAHQLAGGQAGRVDGRRAELGLRAGADQLQVRPAAAGGTRLEHLRGQGLARAAGEVQAAEQLELLGAGEVPALGLPASAGPVLPGRRTAVTQVRDPAPGAAFPDLGRGLDHRSSRN